MRHIELSNVFEGMLKGRVLASYMIWEKVPYFGT